MDNTNSLTHFTQKFEYLINILTQGLKYSFVKEDLPLSGFPGTISEIPGIISYHKDSFVVCFCDIPFKNIDEHIIQYGKYGIGLSKEWCKKQGVTPLRYFHEHTPDLQNIGFISSLTFLSALNNGIQPIQMVIEELQDKNLIREDFNVADLEKLPNEIQHIIKLFNREYILAMGYVSYQADYLRTYSGNWKDRVTGEVTERIFYYESEWRISTFSNKEEFFKFPYDVIDYVIVNTEDERNGIKRLGIKEIQNKIMLISEI
ncbi:MAG: hypothetical protein HOP31_00140 [Ignavibacteria bacterium]|nr:hypothetical protein [Ignavibacteria bacterium]